MGPRGLQGGLRLGGQRTTSAIAERASTSDFKGDPSPSARWAAGHAEPASQGVRRPRLESVRHLFRPGDRHFALHGHDTGDRGNGNGHDPVRPDPTCGLFPITVPFEVSNCDNSGKLDPGQGDWPFLGDARTKTGNEAIVPFCKDKNNDIGGGSAGSVGWLDCSTAIGVTTTGACANKFKDAILNPCITSLTFPTWVQTFPGGVGKGGPAIQDALNAYHDDIVQIPLFDGTCKVTAARHCPVDVPRQTSV